MTYLKPKQIKSNNSDFKKLTNNNRNSLVPIDRQRYEYIKRLLILYKAQLRQTGECHYSAIVEIVKNEKF